MRLKIRLKKMSKFIIAASTLVVAATAASPPNLDNFYCADVTETLSVDGVKTPISTNAYNLCVDGVNMRWSQAQAPIGAGFSIFNGTVFWELFPDPSLPGGFNCTYRNSGTEPSTDMPYRMVTIDANADLNKTETYDGVKNAQNWYAFRPGKSSGGMQFPAEQMHWHVDSVASTPYLLATECVQAAQAPYTGKLQHGTRDFSANRTTFIERKLPANVVCTEKPEKFHTMNGNFKSILFK
jgi:hypothetical protein